MSTHHPTMEWGRSSSQLHSLARTCEQKTEVSVPSTEGMPPLSDITKHKGKRRNRTGSLTAHYTVPELRDRENSVPKMPPLTRIRRPPITGGSWDDNSVGHGSVVSRFRRERNLAVLRTQSSVTNPLSYHSIDTHANVTSTLNLINTTSLSPLLSDRLHDNNEWLNDFWGSTPHQPSAAAKSSAGSMCNIPVSGYHSNGGKQPWDTLSIPELHSTKSCDRACHRSHHRHSYSSGYANASHLHSSPTSGCASIASSDLDSADFMYFNINDDSSYFDGDSLFADSLGIIGNNDTAFSTNILSLLEEGSISCRTPFPASDWPDSISELDFDCSEGKTDDVKNCDALSDIGPSCSTPPQRRRMTKRQSMTQPKLNDFESNDSDDQPSVKEVDTIDSDTENVAGDSVEMIEPMAPIESSSSLNGTLLSHPMTEMTWASLTADEKQEYLNKLWTNISQTLNSEEQLNVLEILSPSAALRRPHLGAISPKDVEYPGLQKCLNYLHLQSSAENFRVKSPDQKFEIIKAIKPNMTSKKNSDAIPLPGNGINVQKRMAFDDMTENNSDSTKLRTCDVRVVSGRDFIKMKPPTSKDLAQGFIEIGKYFDDNIRMRRLHRKHTPDGMKLQSRPSSRYETSSIKSTDARHADSCSDTTCRGCSNGLRRSNSEGNLPLSIGAESQKEHRRQQRQARRWAKWAKTRQRKESRQLLKEHRSGLFKNERKVKLTIGCEEENEVEVN